VNLANPDRPLYPKYAGEVKYSANRALIYVSGLFGGDVGRSADECSVATRDAGLK
jgi:hypothetical protein